MAKSKKKTSKPKTKKPKTTKARGSQKPTKSKPPKKTTTKPTKNRASKITSKSKSISKTSKKSRSSKSTKSSKTPTKKAGKQTTKPFGALRSFNVLVIKPLSKPLLKSLPKYLLIPLIAFVLVVLAITTGFYHLFKDLPSPKKLTTESYPISTIITDRNGATLYEIYADQNRTPISIDQLPDHIKHATIAIEDKTFYKHWGFSIQGITRALKNTLFKNKLQGGSTITQQLVKVGLLTPERTIERKVKEAVLTVITEAIYSKDQILEMYLNHIPYGGTAWGIEAAAKTYFNKSARDLTLPEAALLAGLPQAPTRYSPFSNPENAKNRQFEVLRRMEEEGYITAKEAIAAQQTELNFATDAIPIRAPHFALYVKDLLTEKYGLDTVERGGLRVTTTIDLELQEAAQASVSAEIDSLENYDVGNGAALITKPNTGEILAMIGSTDFFDTDNDGQVNVTTRLRQPGSSIKPLVYATALQLQRATPATMFLDFPTCFRVTGQPLYCPKNYDFTFHGPTQLRFALGNSYNIPAVKAMALNSLESFIATASAMGITTFTNPDNYGLSLGLGGGEVTMLDMATAFGTLANQGVRVPLQAILQIQDSQGETIYQYLPNQTLEKLTQLTTDPDLQTTGSTLEVSSTNLTTNLYRALNRAPAYLTSHILLDNNARVGAFGSNSELIVPNQVVSVKTGTTNDLRDNWTVGYTPEFLTAVWVGNNDSTSMNPYLVSGVTGAAPIFNDIMTYLLQGKEALWPEKPDSVISRPVCSDTGLVSHPDRPCSTRNEFFWEGTEPGTFSQTRKEIWVREDNNFLPYEGQTEGLKLEEHYVLSDPLTKDYCIDCARPLDEKEKPIYPRDIIPYPLQPDHSASLYPAPEPTN